MHAEFFDTSVLVYLMSNEAHKADRIEAAIANGGVISIQVLNEIANVARRKMQLSWDETHKVLDILRELLTVCPLNIETHTLGLALAERYKFSIYDAMIVAAAVVAGCKTLWSEDMQHGMTLKDLQIVNPFRA